MAKSTALAPSTGGLPSVTEYIQSALRSGLFAGSKDPQKESAVAMQKILLGRSMGLGPAESMTSIIVTGQGKISLSANLMARCIESYKDPESQKQKYRYTVLKRDDKECEIAVKKRYSDYTPDGKEIWKWEDAGPPLKFTMEDAKRAGLLGNETWRKYPANMLFARCISNVARTYCPDVFGGSPVYLPDEIPGGVAIDPETLEPTGPPAAKRGATPTVSPSPEVVADAEIVGEELTQLRALIKETETPEQKILEHYGVASLSELTQADVANAISILIGKKNSPK